MIGAWLTEMCLDKLGAELKIISNNLKCFFSQLAMIGAWPTEMYLDKAAPN